VIVGTFLGGGCWLCREGGKGVRTRDELEPVEEAGADDLLHGGREGEGISGVVEDLVDDLCVDGIKSAG